MSITTPPSVYQATCCNILEVFNIRDEIILNRKGWPRYFRAESEENHEKNLKVAGLRIRNTKSSVLSYI